MPPLIVEFAGLPGSGKTTTAHRAVALLRGRGYHCVYRPSLLGGRVSRLQHRGRFLRYRLIHWRLAVTAAAYALSVRPFRWTRVRCVEHLLFLAYYQRQQQDNDYDVVVADQSAIQTAWSVLLDGRVATRRVRALMRAFYRAAGAWPAFVLVDVDAATAARRAVRRPRGWWRARFDRLPVGDVIAAFDAGEPLLRRLAEHAIEATGGPTISVDGSRPASVNAESVASFLAVVLDRRSRRAGRASARLSFTRSTVAGPEAGVSC